MEASGNIMEDQQIEFTALSGSLSIMSRGEPQFLDLQPSSSRFFSSQ